MCLPLFARRKTSRLRFSIEFGQSEPKRYLKEVVVAEFEGFQDREFAGRAERCRSSAAGEETSLFLSSPTAPNLVGESRRKSRICAGTSVISGPT